MSSGQMARRRDGEIAQVFVRVLLKIEEHPAREREKERPARNSLLRAANEKSQSVRHANISLNRPSVRVRESHRGCVKASLIDRSLFVKLR